MEGSILSHSFQAGMLLCTSVQWGSSVKGEDLQVFYGSYWLVCGLGSVGCKKHDRRNTEMWRNNIYPSCRFTVYADLHVFHHSFLFQFFIPVILNLSLMDNLSKVTSHLSQYVLCLYPNATPSFFSPFSSSFHTHSLPPTHEHRRIWLPLIARSTFQSYHFVFFSCGLVKLFFFFKSG